MRQPSIGVEVGLALGSSLGVRRVIPVLKAQRSGAHFVLTTVSHGAPGSPEEIINNIQAL